jgi:hypothetical protein
MCVGGRCVVRRAEHIGHWGRPTPKKKMAQSGGEVEVGLGAARAVFGSERAPRFLILLSLSFPLPFSPLGGFGGPVLGRRSARWASYREQRSESGIPRPSTALSFYRLRAHAQHTPTPTCVHSTRLPNAHSTDTSTHALFVRLHVAQLMPRVSDVWTRRTRPFLFFFSEDKLFSRLCSICLTTSPPPFVKKRTTPL